MTGIYSRVGPIIHSAIHLRSQWGRALLMMRTPSWTQGMRCSANASLVVQINFKRLIALRDMGCRTKGSETRLSRSAACQMV